MKNSDQIFGCIGMLLVIALMVIIGSLMNGWALSVLWGWFMVPVFELPIISLVQAIGISMTIGLLVSHTTDTDSKEWTDIVGTYIGRAIAYPILVVAIGWFVSGLL